MAVALEQFVKQLTDSGVIAPGKLEHFIPPKAHPKDAQELARQLVQSKHLTKFQAQEIYQGREKSLILGNYTVLDKIGAGGMGQVFKAQHRRMDRIVAIKTLPRNLMKDAATVARFEREVRAASKLLHPNIVSAFDADEANGIHFLAMEYVEGSDLSALVKKNGPFSLAKTLDYILQAAKGLDFAHKKGVIHRDIKPANLLLNSEGTVKILDMGLARIESGGDAATQAELTGTGAVMGTVDYMAPEQALSTKHADARADVYSLGCSLFYLLTGKATYDGDTLMAKLLAHREKTIPSLGANVPEQLQAVFEKMVAKKVEDRYQMMTEVVAALEQCNSSQATSLSLQQSVGSGSSSDVMTFLRNVTLNTIKKPKAKPVTAAAPVASGGKNKSVIMASVGAGFLGLAILAGVIFKLQTKDGTLVVEINQPDATVQVFNEEGKVEITRPGEHGTISVSVDPGKHRLKVEKDGFAVFTEEFSVESGGKTSITAKLEPVKALAAATQPNKPWTTPAFQKWMKTVAVIPAEEQVKAVSKKLMELNPAFDGVLTGWGGQNTPKIENGVVTHLRFVTDNVTDISPVRALTGLKFLFCNGSSGRKGRLSDLSPLDEMPLESLYCSANSVSDLSPLTHMKLGSLSCQSTQISDLSPLQGMPTLGSLDVRYTNVTATGIAALQQRLPNCKIEWPETGQFFGRLVPSAKLITTFNDPAFQKWMKDVQAMPADKQVDAVSKKLSELNPGFDGVVVGKDENSTPKIESGVVTELGFLTDNVTDISPVRALNKLQLLKCATGGTGKGKLADLSPLQGMTLTYLYCHNTQVSDLSPLRGMPLTTLGLSWSTNVADLSPLQGMSLAYLNCCGLRINDLTPLKEMPLTFFECEATRVSDLSPLEGMKLTTLKCAHTPVSDLSPLRGMPLTLLYCQGSKVSDLSPLQGMKLTDIRFTPQDITKGMDAIRQMKSVKVIGTVTSERFPSTEFWKKYDAGEFGKPITNINDPAFQKWMNEVAAMTADKQIAAVSKKLVERNPEFDGAVMGKDENSTPTIESGVVTELGFLTDNVTDISPVQALTKLKVLRCSSSGTGKGKLADLSPLTRMSLAALYLHGLNVSDLSPLKGTSLTKLSMSWSTKVSDLSPLQGMPLASLNCPGTGISDLTPLKGMPLTIFEGANTRISDLSPLAGMKLTTLRCDSTLVSDLSPLRGMPLKLLYCQGSKVSDLSPLQGMNLTEVGFTAQNITKGMDVLRQMASLKIIGTRYGEGLPSEFWNKYNAGEFGKPAAPAKLAYLDPAFQAWVKATQALPADKQVEAVTKTLMQLNPGFDGTATGRDGKGSPKIENGVVTELSFVTDNVTDISPVRALVGLKRLACYLGTNTGKSKLSDLSPLQGLSLTYLDIHYTEVTDLSPLKEMLLTGLDCDSTQVTDLSPLQGMPLGTLFCGSTKVFDLSPLKGMKLTSLRCYNTQISDLSPLRGMQLTNLNCSNLKLADLSPLKGMPLTSLYCRGTQVSDLSPLKGMPLTALQCHGTQITDISPLKGMPLTSLGCDGTKVSSLSPLEDCKSLKELFVSNTKVTPASIAALQKALPNCKIEWDDPAKAVAGQPNKPWNTPAFRQWVAETQKLSTEKQIEAVRKKLMELNPGFDGKMTGGGFMDAGPPKIENGVVTEFGIGIDKVTDISPVRTLTGLKTLRCEGSGGRKGKLSDLSPLQGMALTGLFLTEAKISDLSPIQGMKLTILNCSNTQVTDLSPLHGMQLASLSFFATPVSDLSPLAGMPLTYLQCSSTAVADLSSLVNCKNLTKVDANGIKVTPASVAALQKALPNCKITWDDPAKPKTPGPASTVDRERKTAEWVLSCGGTVSLRTATNPRIWPKALEDVPAGPFVVRTIDLGTSGRASDNDMAQIAGLTGLESFTVSSNPITDAGLANLANQRTLTELNVEGLNGEASVVGVTSASLPMIGTFEKLTSLTLPNRGTAADLRHISGLPALEKLSAGAYPIDDAGLQYLTGYKHLKFLNLHNRAVTDAGVVHLAKLTALEDLLLLGTKLSDTGLVGLASLTKLKSLHVGNTQVTTNGLAVLQKALPNCEIIWGKVGQYVEFGTAPAGTK